MLADASNDLHEKDLQATGFACRPGRQAAVALAQQQQPGRRRETFLDRVKRVANQPALAGASGPSLVTVGETAIASAKAKGPPNRCASDEHMWRWKGVFDPTWWRSDRQWLEYPCGHTRRGVAAAAPVA